MTGSGEFLSITPLLAALDRASEHVCRDRPGMIDRILISTDFREGLVASIFATSDSILAQFNPRDRPVIEQSLLSHVRRELGALDSRLLRGGIPEKVFAISWLSRDELDRDWGGSYDLYLRG